MDINIYHLNFMEKNLIQIKGGIKDKCRCECKKIHVSKKDYVWNPTTCCCENGKNLASIMDNSAIMCDEVIQSYNEKAKTIPTNFN